MAGITINTFLSGYIHTSFVQAEYSVNLSILEDRLSDQTDIQPLPAFRPRVVLYRIQCGRSKADITLSAG